MTSQSKCTHSLSVHVPLKWRLAISACPQRSWPCTQTTCFWPCCESSSHWSPCSCYCDSPLERQWKEKKKTGWTIFISANNMSTLITQALYTTQLYVQKLYSIHFFHFHKQVQKALLLKAVHWDLIKQIIYQNHLRLQINFFPLRYNFVSLLPRLKSFPFTITKWVTWPKH